MRVGVLAVQERGREHQAMLARLGQTVIDVRQPSDLTALDALVAPGGKSPVMAEAMLSAGLWEPVRAFAIAGGPVLGTCAGMVLLARASGRDQPLLGVLHATVRRSAFGGAREDFDTPLAIPALGLRPFPGAFRAAPAIDVAGLGVAVLATLPDGAIVAVRQRMLLATAFHPELTDDLRLHRYFLAMARRAGRPRRNR
ncbi:MAG: pyridoxal 5'-phosphate synthase glutaminase subunit PdxT [Chloroflexi bacterium]|nr:pyridoxal 5'-phosphate synthase glutaminase subunit PdxT [Chloroflexota bacterium]